MIKVKLYYAKKITKTTTKKQTNKKKPQNKKNPKTTNQTNKKT